MNIIKQTAIRFCCIFLLLIVSTQNSNAFWPFTNSCIGYNMSASVSPLPLSSTSSSGTSSYNNPRVQVNYSGCIIVAKVSGSFTLGAGDNPSYESYGYYGTIGMSANSCNNTSVYCSGPLSTTPLAKSVCSFYNKICTEGIKDNKGVPHTGVFLGMCAYKTSAPKWVQAIVNFGTPIFNDIAGGVLTVLGGPGVAALWDWSTSVPVAISGYDFLNCMPIPVAPLPPPYGVPTEPLYQQQPTVQPICDSLNDPVYVAGSSPSNLCVQPQDGKSYSTFGKACMRVSFNNPIRATGDITTSFISTSFNEVNPIPQQKAINDSVQGINNSVVEALYAPIGSISNCNPGNNCNFTSNDIPNLIRKAQVFQNGSLTFPAFVGYNLAGFQDICYNFINNTSDQITLIDIDGASHTVQVVPSCKGKCDDCKTSNPSSLSKCTNVCNCAAAPLYEDTQICLDSVPTGNDSVTHYGCVNRPSMNLPQISFCKDQDNTYSSSCMNINIPDTGFTCQISYDQKKSTPLSNSCWSTVELSGVFTDRCFNTAYPGMNNAFFPYMNSTDSCAPCLTNTSCNNKVGLCYNNANYQYGASKICLAPTNPPLSKQVSDPSCSGNCNAVCTSYSQTSAVNPGLCSRVTPDPSVLNPLAANQYCTSPADPNTQMARAKYPIENGLCVDVLLFDFVDCTTLKSTQYQQACEQYKTYCFTKNPNNSQYTNLDSCNQTYIQCTQNKTPGQPADPSNNCFYFAKNGQYTPPQTINQCPSGWGASVCPANLPSIGFFNTETNKKVATAQEANSAMCNSSKGFYLYCCDGTTYWTTGKCPSPSN